MKKVEVKVGNITYTHIGSPEAIERARRRLLDDMTVKPARHEKCQERETVLKKFVITPAMVETAYPVYKNCKELKYDRKQTLQAVRECCNCGRDHAAKIIMAVRKKYGNGKKRAIVHWDQPHS